MRLKHEFFLVKKKELGSIKKVSSEILASKYDKIEVCDDILEYIKDTLDWIPAWSPDTFEKINGLDYYYWTIIYKEGAEILVRILSAWTCLFKNAPEILKLTGELVNGEGENFMVPRIIEINRNEIINIFKSLIIFSNKVLENDGYCIVHMGI